MIQFSILKRKLLLFYELKRCRNRNEETRWEVVTDLMKDGLVRMLVSVNWEGNPSPISLSFCPYKVNITPDKEVIR